MKKYYKIFILISNLIIFCVIICKIIRKEVNNMSLLQYTSKEMFSSTELIRKSKMVFDKVGDKEIEKAIILRDGKPSFILMDFEEYEKIMSEYLKLKGKISDKSHINPIKENKAKEKIEETLEIKDEVLAPSIKEKKDEIKKEDSGLKDFWN